MTRLPISQPCPTTPTTVRLGDLAIAAGTVGFPVTLCYQEFPAPMLSQLWANYIRYVGSDTVHHVHTQKDLNKLPERIATTRIVLVHTPRLHIPTAWSIQMMDPEHAERGPRPAMLSRCLPPNLDEDPGATLVVRATVPENDAMLRWLVLRDPYRDELYLPAPTTVELPVWLSSIFSVEPESNNCGGRRLRDLQVLRSLLAVLVF